jgi:signal transduction histidine kinase
MSIPLRVLFVEDDEDDVVLLLLELRRGGYLVTHERVDTAQGLRDALDRATWDVILSDYSMPGFDGPSALALVREQRIDAPFIIISGTVDEVTAVASMRAGAHDFIAKDKLARLVPAIARELQDATVRAERARMAEQLVLADRMASLGTLAAGVAHEINNPLAAVSANLEVVGIDLRAALAEIEAARGRSSMEPEMALATLVQRLAERIAAAIPALDEASEATTRIREVSGDLKAFSWREVQAAGPVDLVRVVESSLRLAQTETRHRARIVRAYEAVPPVAGTETRLGQLFLNLIVNAAHAIGDADPARHEIRVATRLAPDGRVVAEVSDTGPGIPKDVLPHIFDAFFTTKPRGVGSGLGLAISHRVVTELGGEIVVEARAGGGTAFRIFLPAAAGVVAQPPVATRSAATTQAAGARRGRIMIVDDDRHVLNAARRLLATQHEVFTTTDAREALSRLLDGARFDVVLCDLVMPDFSGMALHREVEKRVPEQASRFVFMSGGAFTEDARQFLEATTQPRLDKPFTAAVVRELIDGMLG